ncbi:MAG: MFS transporter [Archaeoglobus sp.]|nr:MFS transporter [Archaeoglobus sp.]
MKYTYSHRWIIFGILAAIYFFVYFHRTSSAVIAKELMAEFAVSAVAIGLMSSLYFYPYAVMQIPVGTLSDTLGTRKTATFFTFIAFVGATLFGLAANFQMALVARLLMGIGVSGVYIPTLKILSQWFREHEFASLTGVLLAVGNFGAISSAYPLAMMVIFFGWRNSFLVIGIVTLILAILCWVIVRDSPASVGLKPVVKAGKAEVKIKEGIKSVLKNKYFWPLGIWFFFEYGGIMGYQGLWGGPYLMEVYGLNKAEAGAILMMVGIGMMVGSPIIGFLSDKILKSRKKTLVIFTIIYFLTWIPIAFITAGLSIPMLYLLSFIIGFSGGVLIITFTSTKELFPLAITGIATSMVNIFPFIGGAVFQTVMGYLMDLVGKVGGVYPVEAYAIAFKFCFIAAMISLVCSFITKETYPVAEES